jgi:hypothetical protein
MNDLDKKDLLELAQIIKSSANNIGSVSNNNSIILDDIEEIMGCVDAIIEILENKPHQIERMF